MALPAGVTTCINQVCLKLNQVDPHASATANNVALTAACDDWPAATPRLWGPRGFDTVKAAVFCDYWASKGVDVTALRAFFGV